jgi:hypothetical protein
MVTLIVGFIGGCLFSLVVFYRLDWKNQKRG